jgi:predicted double-glycine peptidase
MKRRDRHFLRQTSQTDCGVACALMVLSYRGRKADPVTAVDHLDPDRRGSNLEALRRFFAEDHGLEAQALKVPASKLPSLKGDLIVHLTQQHYVWVIFDDAHAVMVFDPAMGRVVYPAADFAALYSGVLLQVNGPVKAPVARQPERAKPDAGARQTRTPVDLRRAGLFVLGMAGRLFELALILSAVVILYMILNQASFPAILMTFGIVAACGILLILSRQLRAEAEESWVRKLRERIGARVVRSTLRGQDLLGFRGRNEREVSGAVRRGLGEGLPQRSQLPATVGGFVVMPLALLILSPALSVLHVVLYLLALFLVELDRVQICRRSVLGTTGRYSKLTLGRGLINVETGPDFLGDLAKWSIIGLAGISVFSDALPAMALMFWILTAMQIVPLDFRRARQLSRGFAATSSPVSDLTGAEVPLRHQKLVGATPLEITRDGARTQVAIRPLMQGLQQPDLTVREQRQIMAQIVTQAMDQAPIAVQGTPGIGPVRVFGPGQKVSQADLEYLLLARENAGETGKQDTRRLLDAAMHDPMLRDLLSCAPGDFPVFWDLRGRLDLDQLQKHQARVGLARAGHLTMSRLTVFENDALAGAAQAHGDIADQRTGT